MSTVNVERPVKRPKNQARRASVASFMGTLVEMYDFLLYASAAGLIFPALFFSDLPPALGATLGYVTLLTGYIARPIGGILFGHFGDKFGRKRMLIISMMIMGIVSIGIGLLPTYATWGALSAVLLVVIRVIQGLAVGGEFAGAALMAMEHAQEKSRGWAASFAAAGGPAGSVLATFTLAMFAMLPDEDFMSWGWRIPFLLSVVIIIIALIVRASIDETPDFVEAKQKEKAAPTKAALPLMKVLTKYPRQIILGSLAGAASLFVQGLLVAFMVPYVVGLGTVEREDALMMLTASSFVHIFAIPFFAWLSDKLGRSKVMIGAAIFSALMLWPMFAMFNSGSPLLVALAFMVGNPLIQASMFGPLGAFLSEQFTPEVRYTGVSLTYQIGAVLGSGMAPLVANQLVTPESGTTTLAWFMTFAFIISGLAVYFMKKRPAQDTLTN